MRTSLARKHRTSSVQPLPLDGLSLARGSAKPLHLQVYDQLRALIMRRTLRPGAALPSTRALAGDLGVARNTVIAAYEQLEAEGYLVTRPGACAVVANLPMDAAARVAAPPEPADLLSARGRLMVSQPRQSSLPGRVAFHPGTPEIATFPFAIWRRLLARGVRPYGEDLFSYHSVAGHLPLRAAIAAYLAVSRGVVCDPEQIVITTGAQAALDLLARLLLDPGDGVWMEEPGYLGAQSAFLAAGARLHPLRIDGAGWQFDAAQVPSARIIYCTPSCQFPLGMTMRMEQRLRLLELARRHRMWVIEDDFDSEYRFGVEPVPAMQGADPTGRVIYVGTFAKTLFPSLRLGFLVMPKALGRDLRNAINITGQFPPLLLQAALAAFISEGHFARHLRRMRRLYARRRALFLSNCSRLLGDWLTPLPGSAGIQTVWWLDARFDDQSLVEALRRHQLNAAPLSTHYRHGDARNGLVLGYAALSEPMMVASLGEMRAVMDHHAMAPEAVAAADTRTA